MTTYTPTELIETLQERMKGNEGKGSSLGTLRATNDPEKQHLIGVPQFLKYEADDQLIVVIWPRSDYPDEWDALLEIWNHRDDDRLVEVMREVIEDVLRDRHFRLSLRDLRVKTEEAAEDAVEKDVKEED
jgi:hypothetical protein